MDELSFDEAFPDLYGLAYRVGFRIVGQREEAVDIAQETLARAAARWSRVHDHAGPWVATVAGNLAVDYWRKRRRRDTAMRAGGSPRGAGPVRGGSVSGGAASVGGGSLGGGPLDGGPLGVASVDDRQIDRMDLVRALRALPKRQRQVVVLRYLADCSEAEVAALIGCSEGTVKSSASRGLAALRAAAEGGR